MKQSRLTNKSVLATLNEDRDLFPCEDMKKLVIKDRRTDKITDVVVVHFNELGWPVWPGFIPGGNGPQVA